MAKYLVTAVVGGKTSDATVDAVGYLEEGSYTVFVDDRDVKLLSILTSSVLSIKLTEATPSAV